MTAIIFTQERDLRVWSVFTIEKSSKGLTVKNGANEEIPLIFGGGNFPITDPKNILFQKFVATPYFTIKEASILSDLRNKGMPLVAKALHLKERLGTDEKPNLLNMIGIWNTALPEPFLGDKQLNSSLISLTNLLSTSPSKELYQEYFTIFLNRIIPLSANNVKVYTESGTITFMSSETPKDILDLLSIHFQY